MRQNRKLDVERLMGLIEGAVFAAIPDDDAYDRYDCSRDPDAVADFMGEGGETEGFIGFVLNGEHYRVQLVYEGPADEVDG